MGRPHRAGSEGWRARGGDRLSRQEGSLGLRPLASRRRGLGCPGNGGWDAIGIEERFGFTSEKVEEQEAGRAKRNVPPFFSGGMMGRSGSLTMAAEFVIWIFVLSC